MSLHLGRLPCKGGATLPNGWGHCYSHEAEILLPGQVFPPKPPNTPTIFCGRFQTLSVWKGSLSAPRHAQLCTPHPKPPLLPVAHVYSYALDRLAGHRTDLGPGPGRVTMRSHFPTHVVFPAPPLQGNLPSLHCHQTTSSLLRKQIKKL